MSYFDIILNFQISCLLGKFGIGSGRKREKMKPRVIPDIAAPGAIVWNVQVCC
jgi:hypothetical protein